MFNERMFRQNRSHINLPEKRFEIRAEAVQNRHEVFPVIGYENFFDKPLDRLHIFIKHKSEAPNPENQLCLKSV